VADVTDPKTEIALAEAQALNPEAEMDDELEQELPPKELGRIAAQTAKQVILQRVREAEREGIYSEFIGKEGQLIRGVVHRIEKRNVIMEMGKAEAVLPEREQIPGERYSPGDRVRAYVVEVKKSSKGPQITLSRTHPGYLARLFETEIPEVQEGIVVVKAVAREPGDRAKVAVASTKRDVDPIGACVGLRGTRIQVISRDLRGEKIDIVEWSWDAATFVARALSPAKVSSVTLVDPPPGPPAEASEEPRPAVLVTVPDNQLSLAIGKKGQNARLAAKLTGIRIDIKSESEAEADQARADEEIAVGRVNLLELPGVTPELVDKLVEKGLYSPALVLRADVERLTLIPEIGEENATALVAAARQWLDRQPVAEDDPVVDAAPAPDESSDATARPRENARESAE
jgi:N utilization substance protein A